jgi:hypothetical protein
MSTFMEDNKYFTMQDMAGNNSAHPGLTIAGGMGCGSHHGTKKHKKKHSKMRRGGMGCGSHRGSKKRHSKKRHSKKRRGGMGCGSHTKKRKHRKRK